MNERLRSALAALPARQLNLVAAGVVAIAAMLAWTVALRAPLAHWRQQHGALAALQAAAANAAPAVPAPAATGDGPATVPDPLALIDAVSRSARAAHVDVLAAAPGAERAVAGLRARTVSVTAAGSYADIHAWLADIERSQGAVGIVQLDLQPGEPGQPRGATLLLAIYGAP